MVVDFKLDVSSLEFIWDIALLIVFYLFISDSNGM